MWFQNQQLATVTVRLSVRECEQQLVSPHHVSLSPSSTGRLRWSPPRNLAGATAVKASQHDGQEQSSILSHLPHPPPFRSYGMFGLAQTSPHLAMLLMNVPLPSVKTCRQAGMRMVSSAEVFGSSYTSSGKVMF